MFIPKKTNTAYRTMGGAQADAMVGCGFFHKPERRDSQIDFTLNHYGALWLISGKGTHIDAQGIQTPIVPGSIVQRFPGIPHTTLVHPDGEWLEAFVAFDASAYEMLRDHGAIDPQKPVLWARLAPALLERFLNLLDKVRKARDQELPLLLIKAQELLLTLIKTPSYSDLVTQACEVLNHNIDQRLALPRLVESFHISYERFRKIFRRQVGVAPGEYRIRSRINWARELLGDKNLRLQQIAQRLGYADTFTFSRQFKSRVGVSPTKFRRGL